MEQATKQECKSSAAFIIIQDICSNHQGWRNTLVRPVASDPMIPLSLTIPWRRHTGSMPHPGPGHAKTYAFAYALACLGMCLGMPRQMPTGHAKAYAYACQGICLGMPRHMPWHAKAHECVWKTTPPVPGALFETKKRHQTIVFLRTHKNMCPFA